MAFSPLYMCVSVVCYKKYMEKLKALNEKSTACKILKKKSYLK